MKKTLLFVALAAVAVATSQAALAADWKAKAAKKAVGEVAEEAMKNAVEDGVKNAAFNTAMDAARPGRPDSDIDRQRVEDVAERVEDADRRDLRDAVEFGSSAAQGIETAMDVADFARGIDTAIDVADKAKKANKVRKAIR